MKAKIIYMFPHMKKLKKKHKNDAGIDLSSICEIYLQPGQHEPLGTGVKIDIPEGYGAYVLPRSSASEMGLLVHTGTIDSGYQGEIMLSIKNISNRVIHIEQLQRLAQLVFFKIPEVEFEEVTSFDEVSQRGENGFGSTGKF